MVVHHDVNHCPECGNFNRHFDAYYINTIGSTRITECRTECLKCHHINFWKSGCFIEPYNELKSILVEVTKK